MRVCNETRGLTLSDHTEVADRLFSRLKGLLGRKRLLPGQGLLITPCQSVHTFLMRFPIDVIYIDGKGKVCWIVEEMQPNRTAPLIRQSLAVLELPAGTVRNTGTAVGDSLAFINS
ncbi:MAG: DUF192 domain-containing protein [Bacillota bacterium]